MNRHPTHRAAPWLAAMLFAFAVAPLFPVLAHEGEDHGASGPVEVAIPGETLLAMSGGGALFEAVLKHRPFASGDPVAVTFYLVSLETNRPVADATVSANLSEGDRSTSVAFAPKPGGPIGAYSATVTPTTAAPISWLFDVTAGGDTDLIGLTGFQASPPKSNPAVGGPSLRRDGTASFRPAVLAAVGVPLLIAAFVVGRMTARKGVAT
ncbi:MAG: hypothetical protein RKO66_13765 [Candidatus Contendobacter sp.]|nr:hypothetical protein [Candidatus Contendobacter sp.]MDS4057031.1 hypothetical protein [Candidatus Contendobacter sp.]